MPEYRPSRALGWLGALLPASRRRLMFEPLRDELWARHVRRGQTRAATLTLWAGLAVGFLATLAVSWPRYFHDQGRFTFVGRASIALATGLLLLLTVALADWAAFIVRETARG